MMNCKLFVKGNYEEVVNFILNVCSDRDHGFKLTFDNIIPLDLPEEGDLDSEVSKQWGGIMSEPIIDSTIIVGTVGSGELTQIKSFDGIHNKTKLEVANMLDNMNHESELQWECRFGIKLASNKPTKLFGTMIEKYKDKLKDIRLIYNWEEMEMLEVLIWSDDKLKHKELKLDNKPVEYIVMQLMEDFINVEDILNTVSLKLDANCIEAKENGEEDKFPEELAKRIFEKMEKVMTDLYNKCAYKNLANLYVQVLNSSYKPNEETVEEVKEEDKEC